MLRKFVTLLSLFALCLLTFGSVAQADSFGVSAFSGPAVSGPLQANLPAVDTYIYGGAYTVGDSVSGFLYLGFRDGTWLWANVSDLHVSKAADGSVSVSIVAQGMMDDAVPVTALVTLKKSADGSSTSSVSIVDFIRPAVSYEATGAVADTSDSFLVIE